MISCFSVIRVVMDGGCCIPSHLPCHFTCPIRLQFNYCLSPVIDAACRRAANGHSTSISGGGLGKQPGEGKGQEMGVQGDSEMPSASICWGHVLGDREAAGIGVSLLSELLPWALAVPSKEHFACRSLWALWTWPRISAGRRTWQQVLLT